MTAAELVDFVVYSDSNADTVVTTFWLDTDEGLETEIIRLSREEAQTLGQILEDLPDTSIPIIFALVIGGEGAALNGGERS